MDAINLRFLFYGYSAAWIIMLGFVMLLISRGKKIDKELTRLKSMVQDREK